MEELGKKQTLSGGQAFREAHATGARKVNLNGLKPKDLCLVPFRFALAAQAAGWWVRSDIVWAKPNPMPESVTDRPARSHEYVFLLTKRGRYYYDAEAVREEAGYCGYRGSTGPKSGANGDRNDGGRANIESGASGRNCRSVWNIATQSYPGAHFATFPEKLVERMVLAGTSAKGCCEHCGAPWRRVVEKTGGTIGISWHEHDNDSQRGLRQTPETRAQGRDGSYSVTTTGWEPTCICPDNTGSARAVVLDPFCGSGTTVAVAERLGREGWGVDISQKYLDEQASKRAGAAAAQSVLFPGGI